MKKIISTLILLIVAVGLITSVSAAATNCIFDITDLVTYSDSEGYYVSADIENLTSKDDTGILVVASYSPDGKFLNHFYTDISINANDSKNYSVKVDSLSAGYQKAFVLDSWGTLSPLAKARELSVPTKYAIVLKTDIDEGEVKLLLSDGTSKTYELDNNVDINIADFDIPSDTAIEDRIVTYTVENSNGKLSHLEFVTGLIVEKCEYRKRIDKLGVCPIADSTPMIDATKAKGDASSYSFSYTSFYNDTFIDGGTYNAIVIRNAHYADFVVITDIISIFNDSLRFAVVKESAIGHILDSDTCDLVKVLYEGEEQDMLFQTGKADNLAVGDAFFFKTDANGFVEKAYKVYSKPVFAYDKETYAYIEKTASKFTHIDRISGVTDDMLPSSTSGWSYNIWDEGYDLQLAQGVITKVTDDYIEFASLKQIKDNKFVCTDVDLIGEGDGVVTYAIVPEAVAYVYLSQDDAADDEDKFMVTDITNIEASDFSNFQNEDDNNFYENIDFSYANEALVMIVDGEIVAIYAIEK